MRATGKFIFDQPVVWDIFRSSPFGHADQRNELRDVRLVVKKTETETVDGVLVRTDLTGIIPNPSGDKFWQLDVDLQRVVDAFPDHQLSGYFECEDADGQWRLVLNSDRQVVVIYPTISWPDVD